MNIHQNLASFLIENGVPKSHISNLKLEKPYRLSKIQSFYDSIDDEKVVQFVPVNQIKSTSRKGLPDDSWFDLARNASRAIYDGDSEIKSNIDEKRIIRSLNFLLNAENLSSYHQSLVDNINPVELTYYDKYDIYTVGSDGNHRTILAKLTNAPYIKARITTLTFNQEKYNNFILIEESVNKFDTTLNQINFISDHEDIYYNDKAVIGARTYGYFRYYFKFKTYDISFLLSRKDKTNQFIYRLKEVTNTVHHLHDIKEEYIRFYNLIRWLKKWNINKTLLFIYSTIKCSYKDSQESALYQLAFSMILDDLKIDYPFNDKHNYITL